MKNTKPVVVLPYDPKWRAEFETIRDEVSAALGGDALAIVHVGSTSVEGLAAKPVIDIDIVIEDYNTFEAVKSKLAAIGYTYQGDQGIKDRQAFKLDNPDLIARHLYVCPRYSEELRRHLTFRDHLRNNPDDRDWYGEVKTLAAKHYPNDIDGYMTAKHPCIMEIFAHCGL